MPTETPVAEPADPTEKPPYRFFTWMRALGIRRGPGWIGGVCAGVAERLGIDVVLVRGIAVVVAVLGGPALLLYAAGWLLLPDRDDRIHLEQLMRGRFQPAIVGIAAILVLSVLPIAQGLWWAGSVYWDGGALVAIARTLWTVAVIAALVVVAYWVIHHVRRSAPPVVVTDEAVRDAAEPTTVADPGAGTDAPTDTTLRDDELAAWRIHQGAVRAERAAFANHQRADAQERWLERQRLQGEANARYAEKRRAWRLANPRLSAAWVFAILGLALVVGALGALIASGSTSWVGSITTAGLASATLTVGLGIVAAGLARRRNGFLTFVAIVLMCVTVPLAFVPGDRQLVGAYADLGVGSYSQLAGSVWVPIAVNETGTVDVWQGVGDVRVVLGKGAGVHVVSTQMNGSYGELTRFPDFTGSAGVAPTTFDGPGHGLVADYGVITPTSPTLRVWQGSGEVKIEYAEIQDAPGPEGDH